MKRTAFRTLAEFLSQTGTTQASLAQKVGCGQSAISKIAAGLQPPSLRLAKQIAMVARVPIESLLPQDQRTRRSAPGPAQQASPQTR